MKVPNVTGSVALLTGSLQREFSFHLLVFGHCPCSLVSTPYSSSYPIYNNLGPRWKEGIFLSKDNSTWTKALPGGNKRLECRQRAAPWEEIGYWVLLAERAKLALASMRSPWSTTDSLGRKYELSQCVSMLEHKCTHASWIWMWLWKIGEQEGLHRRQTTVCQYSLSHSSKQSSRSLAVLQAAYEVVGIDQWDSLADLLALGSLYSSCEWCQSKGH